MGTAASQAQSLTQVPARPSIPLVPLLHSPLQCQTGAPGPGPRLLRWQEGGMSEACVPSLGSKSMLEERRMQAGAGRLHALRHPPPTFLGLHGYSHCLTLLLYHTWYWDKGGRSMASLEATHNRKEPGVTLYPALTVEDEALDW